MNEAVTKKREGGGRLFIHLICGGLSHAVSAGIALFLTPFLIGRLGVEAYGFYPIALEITAIAALVMGILNATAGRYIAVEYARGNREDAKCYCSTVFFSALVLAGLLLIPLGFLVVLGDRFLNIPEGLSGEIRIFLALMIAAGFTDAVSAVFGTSYETADRLDFRAAGEMAGVLVRALLLWFLLSGVLPISIISVGVAVLMSSVVSACIRFFMAKHLTPDILPDHNFFSWGALRRLLASGTWYSVNELGTWLTAGGLLILVNVLFGAAESGVYSLALTAARVFGGVMLMLASLFIPRTTKQFAKGDKEALLTEVLGGQRLVGFFALVGVSMAVSFLKEFFTLWLGDENTLLLRLLTVMSLLPMLSVALSLPLFHMAVVMNRIRRMALLYLGGSLLGAALALALAFFTNTSILGVALVAFGVRVLWYSVFMPFYAAHLLGVEPLIFFLPILRAYIGAGISVGLILALKSVCDLSSFVSFLIAGVSSLCVVLAVGFFAVYGKPKLKM